MRKLFGALLALALLASPCAAQVVGPGPFPPGTPATAYTPTVDFATHGNLSVSYASQIGYYSWDPIRNQVCVDGIVTFTPTYTTASGSLLINLPSAFTAKTGVFQFVPGAIQSGGSGTAPTGTTWTVVRVRSNTSQADLTGIGVGATTAQFTTTEVPTATQSSINFNGCYFTN